MGECVRTHQQSVIKKTSAEGDRRLCKMVLADIPEYEAVKASTEEAVTEVDPENYHPLLKAAIAAELERHAVEQLPMCVPAVGGRAAAAKMEPPSRPPVPVVVKPDGKLHMTKAGGNAESALEDLAAVPWLDEVKAGGNYELVRFRGMVMNKGSEPE